MNMKKTVVLLWCLLLLVATGACALTGSGKGEKNGTGDVVTLKPSDMAFELADSKGIEVKDFNLGEGKLKNSGGKNIPCPLTGVIAVPADAGPHPLVVIFHGVKAVKSINDKVYAGFDYLVKQLAAEGYVAVSLNINVEYSVEYGESTNSEWAYSIYKQHMALLERANAGDDPGYGIGLKGKVDFDNMHLMGHSRGGEIADSFIRNEQEEGLNRIKSLIRIEATAAYYPDGDPNPDLPIGIIIGEYDGDVPEDGQLVFDDIQKETARKSPASIVFLRGANHAYFNRAFPGGDEKKDGRDLEGKLLSREQQEDFLAHYAAAFLSVNAKGEKPWGAWDVQQAEPDTMFGFPVTASYYMPGRRSLLAVSENETARLTTSGAVSLSYLVKKGGYSDILFAHPGAINNNKELPLYNIRWTAKSGTLSIPCTDGDFSGSSALSLYVATDSSDEGNPKDEPQSFTVTLKDKSGAVQSVLVPPGTSALSYYPGYVKHYEGDDFEPALDIWIGYTPLGELRIPLRHFDKIDLGAISEIVLNLDQTDTGSVMLSGIYLEK
jgi:dienelactone hydrolase